MNLAAYDIVMDINYRKSWIDPSYRKLYSFELPKHQFYTFVTKFDPTNKDNNIFLVLYDEEQEITKNYSVEEKHNIKKYRLHDVWKYFSHIKEVVNINMELVETQDDCLIYKFDIN